MLVRRAGYAHHGVYLGGGRFAHKVAGVGMAFVTLSSVDASVKEATGGVIVTTLSGFAPEASDDDWAVLHVLFYAPGSRFHPTDTVALAEAAARASAQGEPYSLLHANCEHFASWCLCGEFVSEQVRAAAGFLRRSGALLAGVLAGTAVLARLCEVVKTSTTVKESRGRGLRGALGLGRRKVVVTETVTEVDASRAVKGGGLVGLASVAAYAATARLQRELAARHRYRLAVRRPSGPPLVLVLPSSAVRKGLADLCSRLRAHAAQAGWPLPDGEVLCAWVAGTDDFVALSDVNLGTVLERCTSLMLS